MINITVVNYTSNRTSGACGLPNLIPYMYYFWSRDVKKGYYTISPELYARQNIQRLIYALNQPLVRNGIQSAFTNTSVFDRPYLEALFGGATFPDGAFMVDELDGIMEFQKMYLETMSEIRSSNMMTFPVNTISLLRQNGQFVDEEFARYACAHNMKWNDSNLFIDDSVSSLSNCCFDGSQLCLTKNENGVHLMTFKELYEAKYDEYKVNLSVFHNGNWVRGKVIRLPKRRMYKVTTANKKVMLATDNHLFPTLDGDKQVEDITTDDYIMFNNVALEGLYSKDENLGYAEGYLVGMYLGDGSCDNEDRGGITPTVHLSLNEGKWKESRELLEAGAAIIDTEANVHLGKPYNNVYPVQIRNRNVYEFVRTWVTGKYCHEKELNLDCLFQSVDFRQGILDGFYATDGGNSNRIYTTSKKLSEQMECLLSSLGLNSVIDVSDRTNEPVIIRGEVYKRNYPLYCVRWYSRGNKRFLDDLFILKNNCTYFKVANIEPYETEDDYVYCFEMANQNEPYFTLPGGAITHNCRLKSNIENLG